MIQIKKEETGMHNRNKKFILTAAVSALLCVCLWTAPAASADSALAIRGHAEDVERGLYNSDLLIDLYYVAEPSEGGYSAVGAFSGLEMEWKDNEELQDLIDDVAERAFSGAVPVADSAANGARIAETDDGEPLKEGVYLLIARGKDLSEYTDRIVFGDERRTVTIAKKDQYTFRFLPALVVLLPDSGCVDVTPKRDVYTGSPVPQTGQLWWPVPILLTLGFGSLTIALVLLIRKRKKERES